MVGVDISAAMIDLARKESAQHNEAIEFHVANVCDMPVMGQFERVTAAWLFNYAQSTAELDAMFKAVADNMQAGGKLIAYTVDPSFRLDDGNFTKYGVHVKSENAHEGGFRCPSEFVTTPPSEFTFYRWSHEDYERAIRKAGFSDYHWQRPLISKANRQKFPEGYWGDFERNCLQTGLVCTF